MTAAEGRPNDIGKDYLLGELIGQGTFGTVQEATTQPPHFSELWALA